MSRPLSTLSSRAATNLGLLVLAGCALIAAATFASADGTPRRLFRGTHMGVEPKDLVVLQSSGTNGNTKFYRVNTDGSTDSTEFAVPSGYRLVVTDAEWAGNIQDSNAAYCTLRVWVENLATPTTRSIVCVQPISGPNVSTNGTTGLGGRSSGALAGFSCGAAARLTADFALCITPTAAYPGNTSGSTRYLVILRGYLVPEA